MTSYKEWFKKYGREKVDNRPYSYWSEVTIEDLYDNFKARMEAENPNTGEVDKALSQYNGKDGE